MNKETVQIAMSYRYLILCTFSLICGLAVPAHSQKLMVGFKVGGQITNKFTYPPPTAIEVRAAPEDDRVLFGPWGEFRVTHALSLELDALYQRNWLNDSITFSLPHPGTGLENRTDAVAVHSWEFPLILKWRFPVKRIQWFGGAGFSARNAAGSIHLYGTLSSFTGLGTTSFDSRVSLSDWTYAPVVSTGIDIRAGVFHFQPEIRYSHWSNSTNLLPSYTAFSYLVKNDEVKALIGVAVSK